MYPQTLYPKTKQVLTHIAAVADKFGFYLAGGTALALQLGHRKSVDLDFFSPRFPKRDLLLQALKKFDPQIIQEAPGTLDLMLSGVQVSFLEYRYPLLEAAAAFENTPLASILDIACMKLSAVSSRGSKKDFIDLYTILENRTLPELFSAFAEKFKGVEYQALHLLKSLTYFADADPDPNPDLTTPLDWNKVKQTLEEKVNTYLHQSL